jgi:hypothetical protein
MSKIDKNNCHFHFIVKISVFAFKFPVVFSLWMLNTISIKYFFTSYNFRDDSIRRGPKLTTSYPRGHGQLHVHRTERGSARDQQKLQAHRQL